MWIYLSILSAFLLGIYDVAKKKAVGNNGVMQVLFITTSLSALFLLPSYESGSMDDFLMLLPKIVLVSVSWISGLEAMRTLPMTTASTLKASRPVFVVILSIILFGERLNWGQSIGVITTFAALWMLSRSSRKEGIYFSKNPGVWWMIASIVTGVCSALYDKQIMKELSPDFVQSWGTMGIALVMGIVLLCQHCVSPVEKIKMDPWLIVVSVCILFADKAYFYALKEPDAMLSIVSLTRRGCTIVSFALGSIMFKEKNIRSKAIDLSVLLAGLTIMVLAS